MKNYSDCLLVLFLSQHYFCVFSRALEDENSFSHPYSLCKGTSALPEELQLNFSLSFPEKKDASAAETFNVFA